jgi:hypothetical protein
LDPNFKHVVDPREEKLLHLADLSRELLDIGLRGVCGCHAAPSCAFD